MILLCYRHTLSTDSGDFCEFFAFRKGSFLEAPDKGNRRFNTFGYSFRLAGIFKLLEAGEILKKKWQNSHDPEVF